MSSTCGLTCYNRSSKWLLPCDAFNLHDKLTLVTDDTNDIDADIVTFSAGLLLGSIGHEVQTSGRRFILENLS